MPETSARRTVLALLGADPRRKRAAPGSRGATVRNTPSAVARCTPWAAVRTGTRARSAQRRTRSASPGGSRRADVSIAPTARPFRTPGSPSTWSAWKWLSTTSGTRRIPRSRRQRSTACGSGPASTTMPCPGPALTTTASPWPTSQTTKCQPGGGHPTRGRISGCGRSSAISTIPASRLTATGRRTSERVRGIAANVTAARASPPHRPPGHPTVAPGKAAPVRATRVIHATGSAATCATSVAAGMWNGATSSTANPRTVAGATANSADRLHGTATRLTRSVKVTTTGAQTACAAHGTATTTATGIGQPRRTRAAAHLGASSRSAPVASTDRMNPKLRASAGSSRTRNNAAADSADGPCRRHPPNNAARVTRPMSAARSTLGSGRARTTKPSTAPTPRTGSARPRTPAYRSTSSAAPSRIVMFVPLTAVRWVSSVVLKSSVRSGGMAVVSPMTSPGRSPRGSGASPAQARRRRSRMSLAQRW